MRLVGSGTASPGAVKAAAFAAFGVAAVAGLVLAATTAWWLVAVGLVCVLAAWFYTGGSRPYGYLGLGEVMVFVFFGLVAVVGTTYVQTETFEWAALYAAVGVGALACAILVANNLRDIPTDVEAGKRTLAVKLGAERTRGLYALLVLAAAAGRGRRRGRHDVVGARSGSGSCSGWSRRVRTVLGGAVGPALVPVLQQTGVGQLVVVGAGRRTPPPHVLTPDHGRTLDNVQLIGCTLGHMTSEREKQADAFFHALADSTRRDILRRVLAGEHSVSALAQHYPMSFAAVQKHVAVLERAGLVSKRRSGREQLASGEVEAVRSVTALLVEFEQVWRGRVDRIDALLEDDRIDPPIQKET